MNHSFRRQLKLWIGCAAVLPILAACATESSDGDRAGGTDPGDTQATAADRLDTDLSRIAVKLSASKSSLAAPEGVSVTVTLTNGANHPVRLLKWNTPVDGVNEPLFTVTRDGADVVYLGRHYKRPAPRAKDYVVLGAGESLTRTVDLAETYDLSETGNYTIHYRADAPYEVAEGETQVAELVSNDVGLFVEGRPSARAARKAAVTPHIGTTSYSGGCTSSEKSSLATALNGAASYATGALNYLNGTPGSKPRYTTWFGAYTSSRWSTAKTHYTKIKSAFDNEDFTLDCSCTDDYYAYVYPDEPYTVYLCNAFWDAPQTGTDSKAGTLVHETSHFTVTAGTDDHEYGQSACKSLAKSSPTQALDNADSHEYFAENNPAQN